MRRTRSRLSMEIALAAIIAAFPSAAMAQSAGQNDSAGSLITRAELRINVTASVSASCAFSTGNSPDGNYSLGNLENAYLLDVIFSLSCNSPSRVGIVSANGGMRAADIAAAPAGYSGLAPYEITLSLAGDNGASAQETCQSPTLLAGAGGCVFRGPATATNGLRLPGASKDAPGSFIRISSTGWSESTILMASNAYADRLTITISPAT
jgi:hypothetical protein